MKRRAEPARETLEEEELGTPAARSSADFPQQPRFADAGITLDKDHGALSRKNTVPDPPDGIQFVLSVDQGSAEPAESIEAVYAYLVTERAPHFLRCRKALEFLAAFKHK